MTDMLNLGEIIRDCRMSVCESYYFDGPQAALVAVADASLVLAPLVAEGDLLAQPAWDALQEVSDNLTLVRRFGQDAVQHAIAFGPRVYAAQKRNAAETARAA